MSASSGKVFVTADTEAVQVAVLQYEATSGKAIFSVEFHRSLHGCVHSLVDIVLFQIQISCITLYLHMYVCI